MRNIPRSCETILGTLSPLILKAGYDRPVIQKSQTLVYIGACYSSPEGLRVLSISCFELDVILLCRSKKTKRWPQDNFKRATLIWFEDEWGYNSFCIHRGMFFNPKLSVFKLNTILMFFQKNKTHDRKIIQNVPTASVLRTEMFERRWKITNFDICRSILFLPAG